MSQHMETMTKNTDMIGGSKNTWKTTQIQTTEQHWIHLVETSALTVGTYFYKIDHNMFVESNHMHVPDARSRHG